MAMTEKKWRVATPTAATKKTTASHSLYQMAPIISIVGFTSCARFIANDDNICSHWASLCSRSPLKT
jgi:hypothetical protein